LSAEKCATPQADTLIMETTFGLPKYVFPPTEQVIADIVAFCRQALHEDAIPILFGYSLGKSQEVLQALGRAHLPAMLHPQTARPPASLPAPHAAPSDATSDHASLAARSIPGLRYWRMRSPQAKELL
jgi:hypothetical protein